ncbi:MAG: class I SAM-dependent methyltransferase [Gemmataceae bacterium]
MIDRVLEPEVMDTPEDASDYDAMDHSAVNRVFAADFLRAWPARGGEVLDVATGTAQIPIEVCRQATGFDVLAVDAAAEMLKLAERNVAAAGLAGRLRLQLVNARRLPFADGRFAAVVSNSLIHHVGEPMEPLAEMARVCAAGGTLFVRDLLRPDSEAELSRLVDTYAAGANAHQRQLFAESLRAALTLAEVRELVARLGFDPEAVRQTTDRHWTWATAR